MKKSFFLILVMFGSAVFAGQPADIYSVRGCAVQRNAHKADEGQRIAWLENKPALFTGCGECITPLGSTGWWGRSGDCQPCFN